MSDISKRVILVRLIRELWLLKLFRQWLHMQSFFYCKILTPSKYSSIKPLLNESTFHELFHQFLQKILMISIFKDLLRVSLIHSTQCKRILMIFTLKFKNAKLAINFGISGSAVLPEILGQRYQKCHQNNLFRDILPKSNKYSRKLTVILHRWI